MSTESLAAIIRRQIREVPDFPQPGVSFKDITTLLKDGPHFKAAVDALAAPFAGEPPDLVVGIEARGFILGAPLALPNDKSRVPMHLAARDGHFMPPELLASQIETLEEPSAGAWVVDVGAAPETIVAQISAKLRASEND